MLEITLDAPALGFSPETEKLLEHLKDNAVKLRLDGNLYHNYPIYRGLDDDGTPVRADILLVSRNHGLVILGVSQASDAETASLDLLRASDLEAELTGRLLKVRSLRGQGLLKVPIASTVYAPAAEPSRTTPLKCTLESIDDFLSTREASPLAAEHYSSVISAIEGSQGLRRTKARHVSTDKKPSKGKTASSLETEIARYDADQRNVALVPLHGLTRVRGIAGSGKTIVLAQKAAITHMTDPDAEILVTFQTKSLYQLIKRLITRFYRQMDESDPNWNRLHILHAWGGRSEDGVYYRACAATGVASLSYGEAARHRASGPFDYACDMLLKAAGERIQPTYDYIFLDEGQDFAPSFFRLCRLLARDDRFAFAYDEFQNIFQPSVPTIESLFGSSPELHRDLVLKRCYRNPREILVVSHAIGLGVYARHRGPVQMLENEEHWESVGYEVSKGKLSPGSEVTITRPTENSPISISEMYPPTEMVIAKTFSTLDEEADFVVEKIRKDVLEENLRCDDIAIVCADDRSNRAYAMRIEELLLSSDIKVHNVALTGGRSFQGNDRVTFSTVHRAKGNEAYAVYVVGVDALFRDPDILNRNRLFTAMTRAKGWLCMTGVGDAAAALCDEVDEALRHCPSLKFTYPSDEHLRTIVRDEHTAERRQRTIARAIADLKKAGLTADELSNLFGRKKQ